jgi:hypothetical protein
MADRTGSTGARHAASTAVGKHAIRISLPGDLVVTLPSVDRLAFYGGITLLAVLQIVEWPVAAALVVGHILVESRHSRMLREFGEALELA